MLSIFLDIPYKGSLVLQATLTILFSLMETSPSIELAKHILLVVGIILGTGTFLSIIANNNVVCIYQ